MGTWDTREEFMLTDTHIFVFLSCHGEEKLTLMQAFTLPNDHSLVENKIDVLRLSNEGLMPHKPPHAVIRNSIVDPVTGSVGVRFVSRWENYDGPCPKCIDVTLHKPSPGVQVLPMMVQWHDVITRQNEPRHAPPRSLLTLQSLLDAPGGDGYARGWFIICPHSAQDAVGDIVGHSCTRSALVKFTIDATQDRCVATLGCYRLSENARHEHTNVERRHFRLDGTQGRVFWNGPEEGGQHVLYIWEVE